MEYREDDICERVELAIGRLGEIRQENIAVSDELKDYFNKVSDFLLYVYDVCCVREQKTDREHLAVINKGLYEDILPENYAESYANPDYAVRQLGEKYGQLLCALYAELRSTIAYAYEGRMYELVSLLELFLEIYGMWSESEDSEPDEKYVKEAIYYYMYDYADVLVAQRILESITTTDTFATDIIMKSDLEDVAYLYKYGEYITENEIRTAEYLNSVSEERVRDMAKTYVGGYIKGFKTMRIDMSGKKTVNIRYSIGQERMIRYAIELFRENGLEPIIFRYPVSRINRKLTLRNGYTATPANKQFDYDHRMDEALFFDRAFVERKLSVITDTYEKHKEEALAYAGPAVVETFGENPFKPINCDNAIRLSEKQQKLSVEYTSKLSEISNSYIPRDKYSFTIIAYPIPEIGERFEEIYDEIVRINTLDNDMYEKIQQSIIDVLDDAEYVHVVGTGANKTDIMVKLHDIDREKETNFENCLADVNIPLGEVFTSPVLKGTTGTINVSQVYLNELKYNNLSLVFEDGMIIDYSCDNFETEEENKSFIKENVMFNHDTLPMGEFAIGTNTIAYVMAHKFDILYKLPILIVEKMGPHFAVGDTCYSYSEENILYNPDGREIIAKHNERSVEGKYYNCHTDITVPYEEIGGIYAVRADGGATAIIEDGRFVLEGAMELNKPFSE